MKKIQKTYEESADAMLLLLSASGKGLLNIHAMRRASEQFSNKDYLKPSYYDRWLKAMVALCIESSFFLEQEWQAKRQQMVKHNKAARQRKSN